MKTKTLALAVAGALAGTAFIGPAPAQAGTSFIANSFYSAEHPLTKYGFTEWAEIVKDLSGGDLQPNIYTGTVLLAPRASLQGIRDNVVQVATHAAVYTPSELPVANAVQELGFNYTDPLTAIFAVADFSTHNATQLQEWQDNGVVYLGAYATPPYLLFCREPVRNLDEIKGKRIRTAGSTVSRWVELVGGIPVNVPSSEMYSGLDRGSLDCATNAGNDLIDRSLWEVAPHTTVLPTGMYWSGPHWGYNPDFWAGLTADQRATLMEATARSMARMSINYIKRSEEALKEAEAKGNNIYQPSDELLESVRTYREAALQDIYRKAKDTYGLSNGKEVIDDFRATYAKWEKLLADVDRTDEDALTALALKEIYANLDPESYGLY